VAVITAIDTDGWTSRVCPRCASGEIVQAVRANTVAYACPACGHERTVRRMPSDAEAADILRCARERREQPSST